MKATDRAKIVCLNLMVLFLYTGIAFAEGEWATSGGNIYNTNSGNVGIGTTRPDRNLVVGDASAAYTGKLKLIGTRTNTWEANNLYFGDDGNRQRYWMNTRGGLSDGRSWVMFYDNREVFSNVPGGALLTPIQITPDSDGSNSYAMYFHNRALNISSIGNVGIGTTSPQSKFAVNGTITAKEIKVTETDWSDFVFDDAYELPSLNSVESYIKEHNHLPDIPSAKEVEQHGFAISEMLAKQMQKIEEMTLYLIELKRGNDELKAKNAELERRLARLEAGG